MKESEKIDKYLDLARELRKLWNMMATVVPMEVGALGTIPKGLAKPLEIRGRIETTQTTELRTTGILRRVLETRRDLLSLRHQ